MTAKVWQQRDRILTFYKVYKQATPSRVHQMIFSNKTPLTSVRRAICDLTRQGLLRKTKTKRQGIYGRDEHIWEEVSL